MLRIVSVVETVWLTSAKQGLVRRPTHQTLTLPIPFPYWIPMQSSSLADISLQQLKQAIAVREKIDALEKELSRIIGGQPSTAKPGAPTPKRKRRKMSAAARARISARMKARWAKRKGKRRITTVAGKTKGRSPGAPLKDRIVQALKAAGKPGTTVKDIAKKLGKSYGNISVWFHTTGKGIKGIKKVAPGKFAWAS